jgi:hypothetical protein
MKFQDIVLSGLRRRYYTSANKVLRGSEADRKLDIFLTPADAALPTASTTGPMYFSLENTNRIQLVLNPNTVSLL